MIISLKSPLPELNYHLASTKTDWLLRPSVEEKYLFLANNSKIELCWYPSLLSTTISFKLADIRRQEIKPSKLSLWFWSSLSLPTFIPKQLKYQRAEQCRAIYLHYLKLYQTWQRKHSPVDMIKLPQQLEINYIFLSIK